MNPLMFREYDIRGVADRDLPDDVVFDLGQGLGRYFSTAAASGLRSVGLSTASAAPEDACRADCRTWASGADVVDLGVVPSPMLYFYAHTLDVHGGCRSRAATIRPATTVSRSFAQTISIAVSRSKNCASLWKQSRFAFRHGLGMRTLRWRARLSDVLQQRFPSARRFPVVLDAGNGTGVVALPLFQSLGFPTLGLGCEPDGRFPLHPPIRRCRKNLRLLQDTVVAHGRRSRLCLDGDADRLVDCRSAGPDLVGDQLFICCRVPSWPNSQGLRSSARSSAVARWWMRSGGRAATRSCGKSDTPASKRRWRRNGAALGAEMSGTCSLRIAIWALTMRSMQRRGCWSFVSPGCCTRKLGRWAAQVVQHAGNSDRGSRRAEVCGEKSRRCADGPAGNGRADARRGAVTWPDAWALVRRANTQPAVVCVLKPRASCVCAVQSEVQSLLRRDGEPVAPRVVRRTPSWQNARFAADVLL